MLEIIILYLLVNIAIALVLWFAGVRKARVSVVGYFLAMFLLGVVIVAILLILFIIALITGASYGLGDYIETKLRDVF